MPFAVAKDGCRLHYEDLGPRDGPAVLLGYPWNDHAADLQAAFGGGADLAIQLRARNAEVIAGLAAKYRVLRMDYPRGAHPSEGPFEDDLTVATVIEDHLAVADSAGVGRFGLVGYSWSASVALQIAARTERVAALAIGGWPPIDGPWTEIAPGLEAAAGGATEPWARLLYAYAAYYRSASKAASDHGPLAPTCPRLVFAGLQDETHAIGQRVAAHADDLAAQGWRVTLLGGHGHGDIPPALQVALFRGLLDTVEW